MGRAVYRTLITADDTWHVIAMTGPIVHVATRREDAVEVWHIHDTEAPPVERAFRVVGTGHPFAPALAHHVGTAVTPSGRFVWHLFEHERPAEQRCPNCAPGYDCKRGIYTPEVASC